MTVKDLMSKVHLFGNQKVTLRDHKTNRTFETKDQHLFFLGAEEVEWLSALNVDSYNVSDRGLEIHAK